MALWGLYESTADKAASDMNKTTLDELAKDRTKGPSLQERKQELQKKYIQSLQGQVQSAEQAPGALRQAAIDTIANTRAQTGRVLAQGRGIQGGGRGVAVLNQVAQDRGLQEGATNAQFTERIQAAVADAARARSEALAEEGKGLQAEELRSQNVQSAADEAVDIGKTFASNQYYMSDADYAEVARQIRDRAAMKTDPAEQAAMNAYADRVERGEIDFEGAIG